MTGLAPIFFWLTNMKPNLCLLLTSLNLYSWFFLFYVNAFLSVSVIILKLGNNGGCHRNQSVIYGPDLRCPRRWWKCKQMTENDNFYEDQCHHPLIIQLSYPYLCTDIPCIFCMFLSQTGQCSICINNEFY